MTEISPFLAPHGSRGDVGVPPTAAGRRIRVAHCVHGLGLGGAQKVIAAIVRGTDPAAFRHFVYSPEDGVHREEVEEAGATVRVIERRIPKLDPLWVLRLAKAMREDRVEVIHTHLFGDSLHGYLASCLAGRPPMVMTLHIGVDGLTGLQRRGYRWLLSRSQCAVACSASVRASFASDGRRGADIRTIQNGIALPSGPMCPPSQRAAWRAEFGAGPDEIVFATVGRLVEQKGLDVLLAAFAKLLRTSDVPARLVLFGDGPLRAALQERARVQALTDRVVFAGIRPDVSRMLEAVDVVVFSSLFEGLPVALLEAMAAGRCIVATDVSGMVEAARDQREALIVPVGNVDRLCEALRETATRPDLRARLGAAARTRCAEHFAVERMARSYEAVYRQMLDLES